MTYCECGRKVYTPNGVGLSDGDHSLCMQCYDSHRDSMRIR